MQEQTALQALCTCMPSLDAGHYCAGALVAETAAVQTRQKMELLDLLPAWLDQLHAHADFLLHGKQVCFNTSMAGRRTQPCAVLIQLMERRGCRRFAKLWLQCCLRL